MMKSFLVYSVAWIMVVDAGVTLYHFALSHYPKTITITPMGAVVDLILNVVVLILCTVAFFED